MKTKVFYTCILLLLIGLPVSAQVHVTGHIFAEVIEPVSIKGVYNTQTNYIAESNTQNFGHLTLNDRNLESNIIIDNKVLVTNNNQQSFELSTSAIANTNLLENKVGLQFSANNSPIGGQKSTYSGKLNVVVAYN